MKRLTFERARLYDQVRTAHLERAHSLEPASIVYRSKRYDFDPELAAGLDLVQAGPISAARLFARSRITSLEVNEPLYLASLPRTALVLAALAASTVFSRRRILVVTYAIENRDPFADTRALKVRTRIRRRIERVLARQIWKRVDRVAFGTGAARALYTELLPSHPKHFQVLLPALPQACDCPSEAIRDDLNVVFVGDFSARKGMPQLLEAWPLVREAAPGATLTILGKGALSDVVIKHADADASIEVVLDPPREEIHRRLRGAHVLVLPSQRTATWREQVGLPILEGLAHGCVIVTTGETGIADWLLEHGHSVVGQATDATELADAITEQLRREPCAAEVLASLPQHDGRLAADRWLFGDPRDAADASSTRRVAVQ